MFFIRNVNVNTDTRIKTRVYKYHIPTQLCTMLCVFLDICCGWAVVVLSDGLINLMPNSLNFCHINAGSWYPKIDELRVVFKDVGAHVIAVSESWLKSGHSNKSVAFSDYNLFRLIGLNEGAVGWRFMLVSLLMLKS